MTRRTELVVSDVEFSEVGTLADGRRQLLQIVPIQVQLHCTRRQSKENDQSHGREREGEGEEKARKKSDRYRETSIFRSDHPHFSQKHTPTCRQPGYLG